MYWPLVEIKEEHLNYGWPAVLTAVCVATLRHWDSPDVSKHRKVLCLYMKAAGTFVTSLTIH